MFGPLSAAQEDAGSSPEDERREEAERLVPRVPGDVEAFAPSAESVTEPVRPGLTGGADWLSALDSDWADASQTGLLPERTFLNRVRGRLLRGPHGTVIFIPDPAEPAPVPAVTPPVDAPASGPDGSSVMPSQAARADENGPDGTAAAGVVQAVQEPTIAAPLPTRPMLLLPCGLLDSFKEYVLDGNATTEAVVSGQVFLYADRNYVLPTALDRARPRSAPPLHAADETDTDGRGSGVPAETAPDAPVAGPAQDGNPAGIDNTREIADDPDVEALIADLERRPPFGTPRPVEPADNDDAGDAPARPTAPEIDPGDGVYISAQRGRLVRAKNGTWSFQIDNDAPPVLGRGVTEYTLLPCRALQGIESVALSSGDGEAGELSGRAYRSGAGWYLLPTLFQRDRRDGVDPLQ